MDTRLGRFPAQVEQPEPTKFAWPIVLLPELFTTRQHLGVLLGYLATIGWEVYVPELRDAAGRAPTPPLAEMRFADLLALVEEALDALGRDAVLVGHGIGGLVALKMAERPRVKAAVAIAPLVPAFRTRLFYRFGFFSALRRPRVLNPPKGRAALRFVADADPFSRAQLARALVPDAAAAAFEVARGEIELSPDAAPRLVVAGERDSFAPTEKVLAFAKSVGASTAVIEGRGHWLIGGRAVERTVREAHRFLVRSLGEDLLLLYPEEWKKEESEPKGG
jgi:pimeloyl-ACP methyl ester carboxylesterase